MHFGDVVQVEELNMLQVHSKGVYIMLPDPACTEAVGHGASPWLVLPTKVLSRDVHPVPSVQLVHVDTGCVVAGSPDEKVRVHGGSTPSNIPAVTTTMPS